MDTRVSQKKTNSSPWLKTEASMGGQWNGHDVQKRGKGHDRPERGHESCQLNE
jgi:hypothetical protein